MAAPHPPVRLVPLYFLEVGADDDLVLQAVRLADTTRPAGDPQVAQAAALRTLIPMVDCSRRPLPQHRGIYTFAHRGDVVQCMQRGFGAGRIMTQLEQVPPDDLRHLRFSAARDRERLQGGWVLPAQFVDVLEDRDRVVPGVDRISQFLDVLQHHPAFRASTLEETRRRKRAYLNHCFHYGTPQFNERGWRYAALLNLRNNDPTWPYWPPVPEVVLPE